MKTNTELLSTRFSTSFFINITNGAVAVFLFLLALQLMGGAFRYLGTGIAQQIFEITHNPFIGLFIGLLITAILQSSSTTTSMAVAAVASGSFSLQQAIPIVLGANIGTTLTSTIVALSYINKSNEFRRAIAAGTVHDIYNILVVLLVLPLELNYGILSSISDAIAGWLPLLSTSTQEISFLQQIFGPIQSVFIEFFGPYVTLILSIGLLFGIVKVISQQLYHRWIDQTKETIENTFFKTKFKAFGWGLAITSVVQSSSLTTSLVVPLAATGKVTLKRAFHFILGANLGTTITALIAALFKSDAAMSLAIAHFILNFFGVLLFLAIPKLESIPPYLAEKLGNYTLRNRIIGFLYILLTFFVIPFTLIYFSTKEERAAMRPYIKKEVVLEHNTALDTKN